MHPTILYSLIGYIQACWVCVILCGRLWATHWGLTENSTARIIRKTRNSKPVNKHLSYYLPSFLPCLLFFLSWKGSNEIRLLSFLNASDWRLQTFFARLSTFERTLQGLYTFLLFSVTAVRLSERVFPLQCISVWSPILYKHAPTQHEKTKRTVIGWFMCQSDVLGQVESLDWSKLTEAALNCHIWHIFCLKAHLLFM